MQFQQKATENKVLWNERISHLRYARTSQKNVPTAWDICPKLWDKCPRPWEHSGKVGLKVTEHRFDNLRA
jgi:hypothetical protein